MIYVIIIILLIWISCLSSKNQKLKEQLNRKKRFRPRQKFAIFSESEGEYEYEPYYLKAEIRNDK